MNDEENNLLLALLRLLFFLSLVLIITRVRSRDGGESLLSRSRDRSS